MSVELMTRVWKTAPVGGSELLVLLALADFGNDDGSAIYPSVKTIASKARLSEDQARRIMHKLITLGLVELVEAGGWDGKRNRSNEYKITMQPPCTHASTVPAPVQVPSPRRHKGGTRADASTGTSMDATTVPAPVQDDPLLEPPLEPSEQPSLEERVAAEAAPPLPTWSDFLKAFCWVCHGHQEVESLTDKQLGILTSEAKRVRDHGYSLDELRCWFQQVWTKDFRWTKNNQHERPQPSDVRSMIAAIRDTEPEQPIPSYQVDLPGVYQMPPAPQPVPAPTLPPPMRHDDPWATALGELRGSLTGVAVGYLEGSRLEAAGAVDGVPLYRVVCDGRAAVGLTWLTAQAGPAIRRKLGSILGKPVLIEIVAANSAELEPTV